jgi:20S proteasome alpha/beta subunit
MPSACLLDSMRMVSDCVKAKGCQAIDDSGPLCLGVGAVYGYDAVGSFKRDDYGAMGSGQNYVMPLLDNLVGPRDDCQKFSLTINALYRLDIRIVLIKR